MVIVGNRAAASLVPVLSVRGGQREHGPAGAGGHRGTNRSRR
jgi:hypothetical protein